MLFKIKVNRLEKYYAVAFTYQQAEESWNAFCDSELGGRMVPESISVVSSKEVLVNQKVIESIEIGRLEKLRTIPRDDDQ